MIQVVAAGLRASRSLGRRPFRMTTARRRVSAQIEPLRDAFRALSGLERRILQLPILCPGWDTKSGARSRPKGSSLKSRDHDSGCRGGFPTGGSRAGCRGRLRSMFGPVRAAGDSGLVLRGRAPRAIRVIPPSGDGPVVVRPVSGVRLVRRYPSSQPGRYWRCRSRFAAG